MPATQSRTVKFDERQAIFAHEYIRNGMNGKKAAIVAGYTERSAASQASMLLKKPNVLAIVRAKTESKLSHLDATADRILLELSRLAFLDTRKLFDANGALKPIHTLDDDTAAAIAGLDHDELYQYFGKGQRKKVGVTTKIKLNPKTQALELLGKYRKLFIDNPTPIRDPNAPLNITVTLVAPQPALVNGTDAQVIESVHTPQLEAGTSETSDASEQAAAPRVKRKYERRVIQPKAKRGNVKRGNKNKV